MGGSAGPCVCAIRTCPPAQMWHVPVVDEQPRQQQQQQQQHAPGEAMPEFLQTGEGMQADGEVRHPEHGALCPHSPHPRGPVGRADTGAAVHVREDEVHVPEEVRVHRADDDGIADAASSRAMFVCRVRVED